MANFRYKASNSTGKIMNGVIEADSPQDAQRRLSGRGLKPITVQVAVLPKPRRFAVAVERASGGGRWVIWAVLLLGAGAALWWFDPWHWFGR